MKSSPNKKSHLSVNNKETNTAMFEFAVQMANKNPRLIQAKKVMSGPFGKFDNYFYVFFTLSVISVFSWLLNYGKFDNLVVAEIVITCVLFILASSILSLILAGVCGLILFSIFEPEVIEVNLIKKILKEHYNIPSEEVDLKSHDGLRNVMSMLENLSNCSFAEEKLNANVNKCYRTSYGTPLRNFAEYLISDIKRFGVSKDNVDYHIDLACRLSFDMYKKNEHEEALREENKLISDLLVKD